MSDLHQKGPDPRPKLADPPNELSDPPEKGPDPRPKLADPSREFSDPPQQVSDPRPKLADPHKELADLPQCHLRGVRFADTSNLHIYTAFLEDLHSHPLAIAHTFVCTQSLNASPCGNKCIWAIIVSCFLCNVPVCLSLTALGPQLIANNCKL